MVKLSPRSYITGAFDVLYIPLTKYIYRQLAGNKSDWWEVYILKTEQVIFYDHETHDPLPHIGDLKTFREHFDECHLLRLVLRSEIKKLFPEEIVSMFAGLNSIHNDWVHRGIRTTSQARRAFMLMIEFSHTAGFISAAGKLEDLCLGMLTDSIVTTEKTEKKPPHAEKDS